MTANHLPPTVGLRIDPADIRRALDLSDTAGIRNAVQATGFGHASIERWRRWQRNAAQAGYEWPSDLDVARFKANEPRRQRARRYKPYRGSEKRRRIDATGTRRRLQALAAIGWTRKHVAEVSGLPYYSVQHIDTNTLLDTTVDAIRRAYDRLSMTIGPSKRNRALAARQGWPPPLDWEGREIDDPRALSHSQHGALVRAGRERAKGLVA